jgi:hypothetical protein
MKTYKITIEFSVAQNWIDDGLVLNEKEPNGKFVNGEAIEEAIAERFCGYMYGNEYNIVTKNIVELKRK